MSWGHLFREVNYPIRKISRWNYLGTIFRGFLRRELWGELSCSLGELLQTDEVSMVNGRKHINKQTHTHTHTHTQRERERERERERVTDNYADGNNKTIIGSNEKSLKQSLLVDFKTLTE